MMKIAKKIASMKPSPTIGISTLAQEMKRKGIDVINFSAGQPDFHTPENIKEAGIQAIRDNHTKYTPAPGIPEIREAICRKFKKDNNLEYTPNQVIVSAGGKQSIYLSLQVLLEEGDEAIIISPYWVSYPPQVELTGAKPVIIDTTIEDDFKTSASEIEKYITDKTQVLILNSPSNPTGVLFTRKEIEEIAELCVSKNIFVVSDEIYDRLTYENEEAVSIASINDKIKDITLTVNGASKSFSMTGWRVGYAAGPIEVVKGMTKLQSQLDTHCVSISQYATIEALENGEEATKKMAESFDERRKFVINRLNGIEGVKTNIPKGAFYIFPQVSTYYGKKFNGTVIEDSVSFCKFMLEEMKIAIVPGSAFGNDKCLRLSYAASMENLKNGLDRFEEGLKKLED
ncbi:pyridoxal phosphate-dependent aminotransferase [candidate division KSB1 bacterium]